MTRRAQRRIALVIGVAALWAAACSDSDRFVLVTVTADQSVPTVSALDVTVGATFADAGRTSMLHYSAPGASIGFPTTLGVKLPSSTAGEVVFTVEGTDGAAGVARGTNTLLVTAGTLAVTVALTKITTGTSDGGVDQGGTDAGATDAAHPDGRDAGVEAKPPQLVLLVVASTTAGTAALSATTTPHSRT
jgi:hypothetical protein